MKTILGTAVIAAGTLLATSASAAKFDVYLAQYGGTGWIKSCYLWEASGPREALAGCQRRGGLMTSRVEYVSQRYATRQTFTNYRVVRVQPTPLVEGFYCDVRLKTCPR